MPSDGWAGWLSMSRPVGCRSPESGAGVGTRSDGRPKPGEPKNHSRTRNLCWRAGKLPGRAAEALPETLPCVPARAQAR
eukprot:4276146-Pyramimonas_sp.AAC.1